VSKFSAQHYNAIAKDIREQFQFYGLGANVTQLPKHEREILMARSATLCDLALRLARRFKKDNPSFDPLLFLDACSPDSDIYPLSELWEE
jgi:hypothetical protein